jgi:hypothetical protein
LSYLAQIWKPSKLPVPSCVPRRRWRYGVDGMTIAAIADLFGVTRQRISALHREKAAASL